MASPLIVELFMCIHVIPKLSSFQVNRIYMMTFYFDNITSRILDVRLGNSYLLDTINLFMRQPDNGFQAMVSDTFHHLTVR